MRNEEIILVNELDEEVGRMGKYEAHLKGLLHRAFSIFVFNSKGELLLQKRADTKYHSGGLWSNTCCGHPRPGEQIMEAAQRRLKEEMGFQMPLKKVLDFTYRTEFENGLTEHEIDHVFMCEYNGLISANLNEVSDYCYKEMAEIKESLLSHPHKYTVWFQLVFPQIEKYRASSYPRLSKQP